MTTMQKQGSEIRYHLIVATLIRLAFVIYGDFHDRYSVVKYTDIDYKVFSDAGEHVSRGESPYDRVTYRYSPLVAIAASVCNAFIHPSALKGIFCVADIVVGWLIFQIVRISGFDAKQAVFPTLVWLYNPFVIQIASRGSFDTIICALVSGALYACLSNCSVLTGLLLGFATHLKLYPIIYTLPIYLAFGTNNNRRFSLWFSQKRLRFIFAFLVALLLPSALSFAFYGYRYIEETLIYHVIRRDERHNFSPYFYALYSGSSVSVLPFLAQAIAIVAVSVSYCGHLPFALFLVTYLFVIFNKVVTAQYFLWYMCLFPTIMLNFELKRWQVLSLVLAYACAKGEWLMQAYWLEFMGGHHFVTVWMASVMFVVVNSAIVCLLVANYHVTTKRRFFVKSQHQRKH